MNGPPPDFFGDVPFEAQEEARGCGAACLAMIYRALGRPTPQADIWPHVAKRNQFGSLASTTHLMARDAAARGFSAVAFQARDGLAALRACSDGGAHAIVAARTSREDPRGHYTVLLDIDSRHVRLHDPTSGPRRVMTHAGLLELWDAGPEPGEVSGGVMIAVGRPAAGDFRCAECASPAPEAVRCPRCRASVGLRPLAAIGCVNAGCPARLWSAVCCPECDLLWDATEDGPLPEPAPEPAFELGPVFAALDRFQAATTSIAGAARHPDISRLMGDFAAMRGILAQTVQEDMAARARLAAERRAAAEKVAADIEATRARMPPPPAAPLRLTLDPDALGAALLARLGA